MDTKDFGKEAIEADRKKEIKKKTVVHAHDESNECGVGDRVVIMETRPLSKLKRFRVVEVLQKAPVIG